MGNGEFVSPQSGRNYPVPRSLQSGGGRYKVMLGRS